jgi:hypothetical protein
MEKADNEQKTITARELFHWGEPSESQVIA